MKNDCIWHYCNNQLPTKNGRYLVYCNYNTDPKDGRFDVLDYCENLYKVDKYDFSNRKGIGGWYYYDREYGYIESYCVVAWMELPNPPSIIPKEPDNNYGNFTGGC